MESGAKVEPGSVSKVWKLTSLKTLLRSLREDEITEVLLQRLCWYLLSLYALPFRQSHVCLIYGALTYNASRIIPFRGPVRPFGALVEWQIVTTSVRSKSTSRWSHLKSTPEGSMKRWQLHVTIQRWNSQIPGGDKPLRRSTHIRVRPVRGEEQEVLRRESNGLWSITRDFNCLHYVELELNYVLFR